MARVLRFYLTGMAYTCQYGSVRNLALDGALYKYR